MGTCKRCGSYAINHTCHGRDGSDGDLCDVCYWRKRAELAAQSVAAAMAVGQACIELSEAKASLASAHAAFSRIVLMLVGVGAPLNDNVLGFNSEQRKYLHRILDVAEGWNEQPAPVPAAVPAGIQRCLRNAYDHIQHEAYNDALSSILEAQDIAAILAAAPAEQSLATIQDSHQPAVPDGFTAWLCREMPAGTVIADPEWWVPRIARAMLANSAKQEKQV